MRVSHSAKPLLQWHGSDQILFRLLDFTRAVLRSKSWRSAGSSWCRRSWLGIHHWRVYSFCHPRQILCFWQNCRLVENPMTITLKQLISEYVQLTYPITLVCAGNRRKEQNVVRKSKGFSWGPAGVSTALFTGCLMSEVIKRAKPKRNARYVCMEGADHLVSWKLKLLVSSSLQGSNH